MTPYSGGKPQRNDRSTFSTRVDSFITWLLDVFYGEFEAATTDLTNKVNATATNAANAAVSESNALTSKNAAASSATDAAASAAFKGNWSSLSGALNMPASVAHNGNIWLLNTNLANVATKTPGVATEWTLFRPQHVTMARALGGRAYQSMLGCPCPPALDLDSQHYLNEPNGAHPAITVTRASTATFWNHLGKLETAAADVLRHDYDPATGEYKGWLIENEARTNYLIYSNQYDNAAWTKNNILPFGSGSTANAAVGVDGNMSADKIVENTTASVSHNVGQTGLSSLSANGTYYCASFLVKAAERTKAQITLASNAAFTVAANMQVDLSNGSIIITTGSPFDYGVIDCGNGWYQIWISKAATADNQNVQAFCYMLDASGAGSYTGDGLSGLYLDHSQLEVGARPSSIIPTTSAQVTRAADSVSLLSDAFSDWYNQIEGSFVVSGTLNLDASPGAVYNLVHARNAAGNSFHSLRYALALAGIDLQSLDAGVVQVDTASLTVTLRSPFTCAFGYKANDFALAKAGSNVLTDASASVATDMDRLNIGSGNFMGHIRHIVYFPRKLNNSLIQLLSTETA